MLKHVEKNTKNDGPTFFGQLLIRENLGEPWANLFPKSVATLILASKARTLNSKAVWGTVGFPSLSLRFGSILVG